MTYGWRECARGPVKYAYAQTGATNACGSLRRRRRLFRSTTDFSSIFSRPFYHPTARQSATLHLHLHRTRHFVPCRRPFVAFLSSAGFRSCRSCTSGKRRRRLAAADGRLKITATFLFFFSVFRAVVRRFWVGATQPCLGRQHNSIPVYVRRATIAQCVFAPMNNILSYFVSHNNIS